MAGWSIAQNSLLLPRDQPCNVLGNFCNRLTHCQQKSPQVLHQDSSCASHKVTQAGDEGVRTPENAFFAALLVPFAFHGVVLDCRAALCTPSANSSACKMHDIVFLFVSAFAFVAELEMGAE